MSKPTALFPSQAATDHRRGRGKPSIEGAYRIDVRCAMKPKGSQGPPRRREGGTNVQPRADRLKRPQRVEEVLRRRARRDWDTGRRYRREGTGLLPFADW